MKCVYVASLRSWRYCVVVEWDLAAKPREIRYFNRLVPTPVFWNTAPPPRLWSRTHTIPPATQANVAPANNAGRAVQTDLTIVPLRFGDHGTKEMLGVVGSKVWSVSNFAQQVPTTCNRVCKWTQHLTSDNVASVCNGLKFTSEFCLRSSLFVYIWNDNPHTLKSQKIVPIAGEGTSNAFLVMRQPFCLFSKYAVLWTWLPEAAQ